MQGLEISQKEYRERSELGSSDLKLLLDNPYAFKMGVKKEASPSMDLGSAVHCLILEEENFERDFMVIDGVKSAKNKELANNQNKILLNMNEYAQARGMADALLNSEVNELFQDGFAERSFFGSVFEVGCKCRPDYYIPNNGGVILDIKTTSSKSNIIGFTNSCYNYNYQIQAALYLEILKAKSFIFVVIEKEEPYSLATFELGEMSLRLGYKQIEQAIKNFKNLEHIGIYRENQKNQFIPSVELPNYAFNNWETYKRYIEG